MNQRQFGLLESHVRQNQQSQLQLGWNAGRTRKPCPGGASNEFLSGWIRGDLEADAAETASLFRTETTNKTISRRRT